MSNNSNSNRTVAIDGAPGDIADGFKSGGGGGGNGNTVKHSNGNEALDSGDGEELELLLKGEQQQQQQPQCARVNFEEQKKPSTTKKQQDRSEMTTTYSPRKSQLKHQKSGLQLDALRSPYDTTDEQTNGVDETIPELKTFTDLDGRITLASPSLNSFGHPPPTSNHGYENEEYKGPRIWRNFVRDWPIISQPLAILVILLLIWIMGYAEEPTYAVPETTIMRIAFLFVGAQFSGIVVTFLHLPDMLGMLFFGVLYTNMGWADFTGYEELEAVLRELALINIMLLAGFGLDGAAFKKLWFIIMRLTLVPTVIEVAVICLLSHYLLAMPWFWGLLLGLVITAVSPNVVVTVMLKLKEEKLGLNNGIHTLIYAMTTCNDVVSIFTFGVILGVIFNQGKFSDQVLQGPVGIVVGVVYGYLLGLTLVYLPSKNSKYVNGLRFTMTVLGGCVSVMGSRAMGYPSAGALGCVTVAFCAGTLWKKQQKGDEHLPVSDRLDLMWKFLKPVSFALIGKEINFSVLDGKIVGYGLIVIAVSSLFRLTAVYLSTAGADLSVRERAYITLSGFPKATVQAALGPIALDLARKLKLESETTLASNVLVISVIAIIFTAPLGAILMIRLAPVLLKRGDPRPEMPAIDRSRAQSQDDIAIITVGGDNRIVMDSAHTNNGFDHGNSGR